MTSLGSGFSLARVTTGSTRSTRKAGEPSGALKPPEPCNRRRSTILAIIPSILVRMTVRFTKSLPATASSSIDSRPIPRSRSDQSSQSRSSTSSMPMTPSWQSSLARARCSGPNIVRLRREWKSPDIRAHSCGGTSSILVTAMVWSWLTTPTQAKICGNRSISQPKRSKS